MLTAAKDNDLPLLQQLFEAEVDQNRHNSAKYLRIRSVNIGNTTNNSNNQQRNQAEQQQEREDEDNDYDYDDLQSAPTHTSSVCSMDNQRPLSLDFNINFQDEVVQVVFL